MRVGHGTGRLPVLPGERMGGYADRAQGVRGVLDPLEVHVVTFAGEGHRFALVVADLICVNGDVVGSIREALLGLGVDSCWVAATHTHASPEAGCAPGGSATPASVAQRLLDTAVRSARSAVAAEVPASLGQVRTWVTGLAGRRNAGEAAPVEIPVDAVVVRSAGRVAGVVTVSPVHPTVLPADNSDVSADLNGGIRRALGGGGRWVVAATGAAGNISTRHTRRGRSRAEIDRLAAAVAGGLSWEAPYLDGAVGRPVSLGVRLTAKLPSEVDSEVRPPAAVLADARSRQVFEQGQRIARELAARSRPSSYELELQAVSLAGITLVAVPGELFLELGESIRAAAGSNVVVLGYANGYLGYLPARGTPPTYETLVSPVRLGSGEEVADAAVRAARSAMSSAEPEERT